MRSYEAGSTLPRWYEERDSKKVPGAEPRGHSDALFLVTEYLFLVIEDPFLAAKTCCQKIHLAAGLWSFRDDLRVTDLLNLADAAVRIDTGSLGTCLLIVCEKMPAWDSVTLL